MHMRVLHILSQRPGRTGSGVTLEALVRGCTASGYEQRVIVGTDTTDPTPTVADLPSSRIHPLVFGGDSTSTSIDFPLPGMSDVMPYRSTVFSQMTPEQLEAYREAWRNHIMAVLKQFTPTIIHSNHIWIMSSMLASILEEVGLKGKIPIVTHVHATGLRQMGLCPHLADGVARGCSQNQHFVVLHQGHQQELQAKIGVPASKITVVGAGYNESIFFPDNKLNNTQGTTTTSSSEATKPKTIHLLYAGKFAIAKGLSELLDAVEQIHNKNQQSTASSSYEIKLHIAGSGSGEEADKLRKRMESLSSKEIVEIHGQVNQTTLANSMRTSCDIFVLPSYYEGLPLVLVEAAACGCRLVATNLPGVQQQLAQPLANVLELVQLPAKMATIDTPRPDEIQPFVHRIVSAIEKSVEKIMEQQQLEAPNGSNHNNLKELTKIVEPFTWTAVYKRIEDVWQQQL